MDETRHSIEQAQAAINVYEETGELPAYVRRAMVEQRNRPKPAVHGSAQIVEPTPPVSAFTLSPEHVPASEGRRRLYRSDIRTAAKAIRREALKASRRG